MLQIMWMSSLTTCVEATDKCRQTCLKEMNNTFNGNCPTPESCNWQCAAERFERIYGKCEGDRVYHCARNYTDKNLLDPSLPRGYAYIEACAKNILCATGTYNNIHVNNFTLKHCLTDIINHFARIAGKQPAISTVINTRVVALTGAIVSCIPCENPTNAGSQKRNSSQYSVCGDHTTVRHNVSGKILNTSN